MKLDKQWRVLTVGDGDLSFSDALSNTFSNTHLTASIYDSEQVLREKYQDHALDSLINKQYSVLTSFDVTNYTCWEKRISKQFDVVIFQFPLIPAFVDRQAFLDQALSVNTLNRRLLRYFLIYATRYALDPNGPMLCIITSKDVKPYCEWDIEGTLNLGLDINYLGQMPFEINQFPGYKIRNVDRDKHVKDTSGTSYYWSQKASSSDELTLPYYLEANHCSFCRAGPFLSEKDKQAHYNSKKHKQMFKHHQDWLAYLES